MIRSGLVVFGSGLVEAVILMVRNVLLARMLSVTDFGIAATFSILVVLMDVAQNAGINRMIVQARDGDDERLQKVLHSVQAVMGLATAAIIAAISWPFAELMNTSGLAWAYLLLATVPLMRGFGHLDIFRMQREHRFGPSAIRQITPQVLSLAALWPAYLAFGDYRTALAAILVQQVGALVASHVGAKRPFRMAWDPGIAGRAVRFGLPLLLNGGMLYLVTNGDRMLVANLFGLDSLGWFSAALLLTLNPLLLVARSLQTLFLPILSRAQDDLRRMQQVYEFLNGLVALCVLGFVIGAALLGGIVIEALYGARYLRAEPILLLLALMQGIRLMRTVPSIPAMAVAQTTNPLYSNLVRIAFIPAALFVGLRTHDLHLMIGIGIAGEAVATFAAIELLRRKVGLRTRAVMLRLVRDLLAMACIGAVALLGAGYWLLALPVAVGLLYLRSVVANWPDIMSSSKGTPRPG